MDRRTFVTLVFLCVIAPCGGTVLIVAEAGAGDCIQVTTDATRASWTVDPDKIVGFLLPPIPTDPNQWTVTAGKYNRVGTFCDPNGDPVVITLESAPASMSIVQDNDRHTWTIAGDLEPGPHYIVVKAVDVPRYGTPITTVVTVAVLATVPPNRAPVLN